MKANKVTQKKLALTIGVHESTLGRFLNGTTEKLSEESVIRIARVFDVSTDFILGTTTIPDKKNYDISELGFEDDMEHPLNETAKHFHLSESRARSTETLALDNVRLELPW